MEENGFKMANESSRRHLTQTITDADYADGIPLLANTPVHPTKPNPCNIDRNDQLQA